MRSQSDIHNTLHLSSARYTSIVIACLLYPLFCHGQSQTAQPDRITLYATVYDKFLGIPVKATAHLMRTDSTLIAKKACKTKMRSQRYKEDYYEYFTFDVKKEPQTYLIKVTANNYYDCYQRITVKPRKHTEQIDMAPFLMRRKQSMQTGITLDEVEVKATRIQVAYRGDTLVYDAAAFALPDGSMLDALVRQLPGAVLKDDNSIYVNGRRIDYLMLNGRNFFKGKNKVLLENLPYFTVKEVKVYDRKRTQLDIAEEGSGSKKDYVMDVSLKKEFAHATIFNAEAGAGSHGRWMTRAAAIGIGKQTNVMAYVTANNLEEDRKPGRNGEWQAWKTTQYYPQTTKETGVDIESENRKHTQRASVESSLQWVSSDAQSHSVNERFIADGNTLTENRSNSQSKPFQFRFNSSYTLSGKLSTSIRTALKYNHNTRRDQTVTSTSRDSLMNRTWRDTDAEFDHFDGNLDFNTSLNIPRAGKIGLRASGSYNHTKDYDDQLYRTWFADGTLPDNRHTYMASPRHSYSYSAGLNYEYYINKQVSTELSTSYLQIYSNDKRQTYRLDWLDDGQYDELGMLPSTLEALLQATDKANSFAFTSMRKSWDASLRTSVSLGKLYASVYLPIDFDQETLPYRGSLIDTIAKRNYVSFRPYLSLSTGGLNRVAANYSHSTSRPSLLNLLPVTDNTNPLHIYRNNPALRDEISDRVDLSFFHRPRKIGASWWLKAALRTTRHATGTRTTVDSGTGVTTYMTDNVEKTNWHGRVQAGLTTSLGKRRRWRLEAEAGTAYQHNVDFAIAYDKETTALSEVNTVLPEASVKLGYSYKTLVMNINGKLTGRLTSSNRAEFVSLNAFDYQYGTNIQYTLPSVNISLSTDLTMYSRRGYNLSSMNDDELLWNAMVSYPLIKGKVVMKLQAFDILHQISKVNYHINAQGRTESWQNTIPRYVMLSFAYNLTKGKKHKKLKEPTRIEFNNIL